MIFNDSRNLLDMSMFKSSLGSLLFNENWNCHILGIDVENNFNEVIFSKKNLNLYIEFISSDLRFPEKTLDSIFEKMILEYKDNGHYVDFDEDFPQEFTVETQDDEIREYENRFFRHFLYENRLIVHGTLSGMIREEDISEARDIVLSFNPEVLNAGSTEAEILKFKPNLEMPWSVVGNIFYLNRDV